MHQGGRQGVIGPVHGLSDPKHATLAPLTLSPSPNKKSWPHGYFFIFQQTSPLPPIWFVGGPNTRSWHPCCWPSAQTFDPGRGDKLPTINTHPVTELGDWPARLNFGECSDTQPFSGKKRAQKLSHKGHTKNVARAHIDCTNPDWANSSRMGDGIRNQY